MSEETTIEQPSTAGAPPLRADARRNRLKVLEAAQEVFAAEGMTVPIDDIARRAGVGAGTVYRHFPTKEALFEAVVAHRIGQLVAEARALASADPAEPGRDAEADTGGGAGEAFFSFFARVVDEAVFNAALYDALAAGSTTALVAVSEVKRELTAAIGDLLSRAQRAGAVRADITAAEVGLLVVGCLAMERQARDAGSPGRMVALVCDGLASP